MKTIYRYTSTNLDGTKFENALEADDKLVDGVAQAITAATNAYVAGVEAKIRSGQVKLEAVRHFSTAISMLASMYGAAASVSDLPATPPSRSQESLVIEEVLNSLTAEQKSAICGDWTAAGECSKQGILTEVQMRILVDVMNEKISSDALDELIYGDNAISIEQQMELQPVFGFDFTKIASFAALMRDRRALLERRKQAEAEAKERADHSPAPPCKIVLEGGRVAYEAMSHELVQPGLVASVEPGTKVPYSGPAGQGWPGLPETAMYSIAVEADFKPEKIIISPGFELVGAFGGSRNFMPFSLGTIGIPAEHLASDTPQPDYPLVEKGLVITLRAKNVTGKQLALWGRVEGREVEKPIQEHGVPCTRCMKCGYLLSFPFTHMIKETCIYGEHAWQDFPHGESEADLKTAAELVAKTVNKA